MYLNYYQLKFKPFEINPNPDFLWFGEAHRQALASLEAGVRENLSLMLLMGDPGTGKTTLINALSKRLGNHFIFAQVTDPSIGELDFFNFTADELGFNKRFTSKDKFLKSFDKFLRKVHLRKKKVILVVDEVQRTNLKMLDQIYLLANMGKLEKTLITTILVGQNEFNSILKKKDSIRQRINLIRNLPPLRELEIEPYIDHRLRMAGADFKIFDTAAIPYIFNYSNGIPRKINKICDLSLVAGYRKKKTRIRTKLVKHCIESYDFSYNNNNKATFRNLKLKYLVPAPAVLVLLMGGYLFYDRPHFNFPTHGPAMYVKALGILTGSSASKLVPQSNQIRLTAEQTTPAGFESITMVAQSASGQQKPQSSETHRATIEPTLFKLETEKARVAALEKAAVQQRQLMDHTKKKIDDLGKELDEVKKTNAALVKQLTDKDNLIEELERLREQLRQVAEDYKVESEKSRQEVEALKEQLAAIEREKNIGDIQMSKLQNQGDLPANDDAAPLEPDPPDPIDIIDWVIEKKSQ